jgi:hypothetical protein
MIKPTKKAFLITLIILVAILIGYGVSRMLWGPLLPGPIDKNLPDALIIIALGIMLWNRQIINEEKKAAEAEKAAQKLEAESSEEAASDEAASGKEDAGAGD